MKKDNKDIEKVFATNRKAKHEYHIIDTYEAGFLGYFIQSLSHIATDTLFMNTMAYNEAFTTKAVLNSSLVNLANMFGYDYRRVVPASGVLTIKVPLERVGFEFVIPLYTEAIADNIPYRVVNRYNVQVILLLI